MQKVAAFLVVVGLSALAHAQPVTTGGGLTRVAHDSSLSGDGRTATPLSLRTGCTINQILKYSGAVWLCAADAGGVTDGDKGDITVTGSGAVFTIDAAAVGFSKIASIATARIVGRDTAGSGVLEELTGTRATALLDTMTSTTKGLAPASGGGTVNYLRADGTWATPPGTGGISGLTTNTITKATSATTIGNSTLTDTGTLVTSTSPVTVDVGTSSAIAALANSNLIIEGAAAVNNYVTMMTPLGVNAGLLFNTPNAASDGYLIYDSTARRIGIAAGGLQNLQLTGTLFSIAVASTLSGLVTATAGVTTPANLTTTGTGDLVSGDQLTVASHATISGNATVAGNATLGDASASDTHTINGTTNIVGATAGTSAFAKDGGIGCNFADNGTSTCYINQYGFNGGLTQFRNLTIQNGNGGTIARFNASTTLTEMFGAATVYGNTTNGDADTDTNNERGTWGVSGADVTLNSCTGGSATGEAQSFQVDVGNTVTACVINLNRTFASAPYCTFSAADGRASADVASSGGAGDAPYITSTTTTVTINATVAFGGALYNVFCPGRF